MIPLIHAWPVFQPVDPKLLRGFVGRHLLQHANAQCPRARLAAEFKRLAFDRVEAPCLIGGEHLLDARRRAGWNLVVHHGLAHHERQVAYVCVGDEVPRYLL
jgi:hypothetical protein